MASQQPNSTAGIGRGMFFAAWLVLLGLLTLFFSNWEEKQKNPNMVVEGKVTSSGVREVILKRNRLGHYVASGQINHQPVVFLLDTGATGISIPGDLAKRLGLKRGYPYTVGTANGTITVYATKLDQLSLGTIELRNINAHINPHMKDQGILLGMSVLKNLEFTQRGNTLTLRQYP